MRILSLLCSVYFLKGLGYAMLPLPIPNVWSAWTLPNHRPFWNFSIKKILLAALCIEQTKSGIGE